MPKKRQNREVRLPVLRPDAAGADIGAEEIFVAVPADRDSKPVRRFSTFTQDLNALADWLTACEIRTVAMESTGVYWIPLYQILEGRGFEVYLVNAQYVRNVPGRKSDVSDCQWIQYLHSTLRQSLAGYRYYQNLIAELDEEINRYLRDLPKAEEAKASPPPRTKTRVYQKQHNDPAFDLRGELYRIVGVDLTDIPGINAVTAHTIVSEIGTDVSRFRNASAFASWLGLCPEKQVSGGKVLYTKTRPSQK